LDPRLDGRPNERPPAAPEPGRLYRFAWGFYLFLALAGVLWIGITHRIIPLSLFFRSASWWIDLLLGLGAGLFLLSVWAGTGKVSPLARELEARLARLLGAMTVSEAVGLALLSGFAEELFFRGALQPAAGMVVATVLFGLLHSGPGSAFRLWTFFACLAGAVFGLLMQWRGNLLAPIVGHFVVNAVNLSRLGRHSALFGRLAEGSDQEDKEI